MTAEAFATWLRGFLAALGGETPTPDQWRRIAGEFSKIAAGLPFLPVAPAITPWVPADPWPWIGPVVPTWTDHKITPNTDLMPGGQTITIGGPWTGNTTLMPGDQTITIGGPRPDQE